MVIIDDQKFLLGSDIRAMYLEIGKTVSIHSIQTRMRAMPQKWGVVAKTDPKDNTLKRMVSLENFEKLWKNNPPQKQVMREETAKRLSA